MRAFKIHIKWTGRTSRPAGKVRALARRAAGGPVAEQPAGRDAGIADDESQRKDVGKPLPRFPGAYRGFGVSELGGHFFLGEVVFEAPASEDDGKIRTQTAARVHALFLAPNAGLEKLFLPANARPAGSRISRGRGWNFFNANSITLRHHIWIRAEKPLSVEMNQMFRIFSNPNFRLP